MNSNDEERNYRPRYDDEPPAYEHSDEPRSRMYPQAPPSPSPLNGFPALVVRAVIGALIGLAVYRLTQGW